MQTDQPSLIDDTVAHLSGNPLFDPNNESSLPSLMKKHAPKVQQFLWDYKYHLIISIIVYCWCAWNLCGLLAVIGTYAFRVWKEKKQKRDALLMEQSNAMRRVNRNRTVVEN